jgi:hypothetical protein
MRRFAPACTAVLLLGCGGGSSSQAIPLDQVPPAILKTSQEKLPEVKFEQAVKRSDGSYEVRGRDKNGKVRDVEFCPNGEFVEVE